MPINKKDQALLQDVRKYALEAKGFVAKLSEAAYVKDLRTQRATERSIEIVGEASKNLSQDVRELYPDVPFGAIIGMRNLMAHGYGKIDPKEIWKTAKKDIPALLQALDSGPKFQ